MYRAEDSVNMANEATRQKSLDDYEILDTAPEQNCGDLVALAPHIGEDLFVVTAHDLGQATFGAKSKVLSRMSDANPARTDRLMTAGASRYITKPFEIPELHWRIPEFGSKEVSNAA